MSLLLVRIVLDNAAGSCSSGGVHASRPATHGNRLPDSGSTTCIRSQPSRVTRLSLQVSRFHLRKSPMTTSRSWSTATARARFSATATRSRQVVARPGREIGDRGRFARVDARHDESGELSGDVRGVLGPRADHRAGRVGAVGGWIGDHRLDPRLEVRSSLQSCRQVLLERQIRPSRDDGVDHCVPVLVELFPDLVCLAGPPTDELRHRRPLPVAPRPAVTVTVLFVGSPPDPSGKPRSGDRAGYRLGRPGTQLICAGNAHNRQRVDVAGMAWSERGGAGRFLSPRSIGVAGDANAAPPPLVRHPESDHVGR